MLLGMFFFVTHCNFIRISHENKKERLSYRIKFIEEFA